MRSIKFRGISTVNDKRNGIKVGDFVYGCFAETNIDCQILFGDGEQISVDRKTVGQYTGRKDKNGVEIYEDDILSEPVSPVGGNNGGYLYQNKLIEWLGSAQGYGIYYPEAASEVIGNIHQTPELMK